MLDAKLSQMIEQTGQQHLLRFWKELSAEQQKLLAAQLADLDWDLVSNFAKKGTSPQSDFEERARRAAPPAYVVRTPKSAADRDKWRAAREIGENALREGKVGAVLLAGGQGTRLGFKQSKGLFPIGPVTNQSLLQILATKLIATSQRYGTTIPYFVMTSDKTHDEIEEFYRRNNYFGLDPKDVFLFPQGFAPSVDLKSGKVLLADKGNLSMSPDGHGGLFSALWKAGLFDEMKRRGIEYIFSHQVDNPLARVCDPEFIGLHLMHESEVSTKVVAKTGPDEKVGVAVDIDGRTQIIEYSDLPKDLAQARDAAGDLKFWAGSTAIHLFNRSFLERVATSDNILPWHRAIKKIPHIDEQGNAVEPTVENGVKFERFIFDTLPLAKVALIVETVRDDEFAPLKNKEGEFSPDYVRDRMVRLSKRWLNSVGVNPPDDVAVEISPRFALSPEDLSARTGELAAVPFDSPTYLGPKD
ncbi:MULTISPECIES: UTP--glucose-1-phosphate uridylyltransferase [unclassified Schlesneria]|uniref:UTP--glucose-1-phosphate uridylyltransferase n=1 Tax=unclassified Schlesneria TaxID=2762017 RepID=UPI002F0C61A5